jgi:serine/threonine protein phosphatase PrpC
MESSNIFSFKQSSIVEQNSQNRPIISLSGSTDIGGGRENQDRFLILELKFNDHTIIILIILDGHGQNGEFIAEFAKETFQKYFSENIQLLVENTQECLNRAYSFTNEEIRNALKENYEKENKIVQEVNGYLTTGTNYPSLISGGTTCTIAVIIDNIHLYISNVGDSDAIIISKSNNNISSEVITGNHSPENIDEFERVINNFPNPLLFEYDKSREKDYRPIFEKDRLDGKYKITRKGNYVKNVRHEFGSVVYAPKNAPFNSGLSMTRSLGDFYLVQFGLTSIPTIKYINLSEKFKESAIISILLASDGVWDNWTYETISNFILNEDYLNRINNGEDISEEVCNSLISKNDELGRKHFGTSRDNATAIVVYLKKN